MNEAYLKENTKELLIDNDYESSIKREDKPIIWIDKEVFTLKRDKDKLQQENKQLKEVIEEVREYLTSYNSIHTIQFGIEEDSLIDVEQNKMLDEKTITEMTHRYLKVHDKLLQILDKVKD